MSEATREFTLDRILEPVGRCLTRETALRLLDLRADPDLQRRVDFRAARCNEGVLTPEEREEYDLHVTAGAFIALLQARARRLLAVNPAP